VQAGGPPASLAAPSAVPAHERAVAHGLPARSAAAAIL